MISMKTYRHYTFFGALYTICVLIFFVSTIYRQLRQLEETLEMQQQQQHHDLTPNTTSQELMNSTSSSKPDKVAYVLYATDANYACAALVLMHQLRHELNTSYPIIFIVTPTVPEESWRHASEKYSAIIKHWEAPKPPPGNIEGSYYHQVMTKLLVFRLYEDHYDRVLILDSDQLILRSLDHLFEIPGIFEVAAPPLSWGDGSGITSTLLLVNPSEALWRRVEGHLNNLSVGEFDMDLVNREFKNEMLILPAPYCVLNSFFETGNPPKWLKTQPPSPSTSNSTSNIPPSKSSQLHYLYNSVAIMLHFTALGKPWTYSIESVRAQRKDAHELFAEQFERWNRLRGMACAIPPFVRVETTVAVTTIPVKRRWLDR